MESDDYNRKYIKKIDQIKRNLIEISNDYRDMDKKTEDLFNTIKNMDFEAEKIQDPCIECIVKPICELKKYINNNNQSIDSFNLPKGIKDCNAKLKSFLLKRIKTDIKAKNFTTYRKNQFISKLKGCSPDNIYPKLWNVEE